MNTQPLSTLASDVIASYGNTVKSMINIYQVGGERVIGAVGQSLQGTLARRGARLMPKLRAELLTTQKKVSGYYSRGLQFATGGADMLVDTVVDLAAKGVHGIAANAQRFDKATGTNALHRLSNVVLPAAQAVSKAADKVEAHAAQIEHKIAREGAVAKTRRVTRKVAVKAKRATRKIAQPRG